MGQLIIMATMNYRPGGWGYLAEDGVRGKDC